LKRVLTALVLIPLVLALLFYAPHWLFAGSIGVVALLAADEFLRLADGYGINAFRKTTLFFIALFFAGLALKDVHWKVGRFDNTDELMFSIVVRVFPLLLLVMAMARDDLRTSLPGAVFSYLAIPYIALTLGELVNTRQGTFGTHLPFGTVLLLYFLILIWSGDVLAYYVGRSFGRHALAPNISPKKTWEGAVASFLGAIGIGILLFEYVDPIVSGLLHARVLRPNSVLQESAHLQPRPLFEIIVFSALINLAAQAGDLVESMMKRGAGVKDSGSLLPGHGGVLDRIDAILLAAPVLWYYASIIKLTG